jgi:uncharacterized phage infection (PIP) family protein YhgE
MTKIEDDVNALFKLPLNEFIEARKTLATQLKKSANAIEAERVKLLAKPSLSAWSVNQLYWSHREPFDELLASGQRFRKAQTSGKIAEMREALDARREALARLSQLASALLSDAPDARHNPSLDTIRRITSTLEAVSASAVLPDGATLGRLSKDIDPPGFESFASFTGNARVSPARAAGNVGVSPAKKSAAKSRVQSSKFKAQSTKFEEARQVKLAAAKASLQNAKRSLTGARARAQSLESELKKADARAKEAQKRQREAEKESREAEERLKKANSAAADASQAALTVRDEVAEASATLADAQCTVEKATRELESLFRSTK